MDNLMAFKKKSNFYLHATVYLETTAIQRKRFNVFLLTFMDFILIFWHILKLGGILLYGLRQFFTDAQVTEALCALFCLLYH